MNQVFRIMTFNIRQDNAEDGEYIWQNRKVGVMTFFQKYEVGIAGLQEAFYGQVMDLDVLLPAYDWIGVGREDGCSKGEFAPIFYNRDRFSVLDWGNFWLSESPDTPGSIGWDAACTRICTWGKFIDLRTGKIFVYFNAHFDHVGKRAVLESAHLVKRRIQEISGSLPVILGGDFNQIASESFYQVILEDRRGLVDTETASECGHIGPSFSFHDFKGVAWIRREVALDDNLKNLLMPIDYIFISEGFRVFYHATLKDQSHNIYASDHMPIISDLTLF